MSKIALGLLLLSAAVFSAGAAEPSPSQQRVAALDRPAATVAATECRDGIVISLAHGGLVQECDHGVWSKPIAVHALVASDDAHP